MTSHGPIGPKVSQPLPLLHWLALRFSWNSRSDTSLIDAVAGDVAQRILRRHIPRGTADDDAELDFPVELRRVLRHA